MREFRQTSSAKAQRSLEEVRSLGDSGGRRDRGAAARVWEAAPGCERAATRRRFDSQEETPTRPARATQGPIDGTADMLAGSVNGGDAMFDQSGKARPFFTYLLSSNAFAASSSRLGPVWRRSPKA